VSYLLIDRKAEIKKKGFSIRMLEKEDYAPQQFSTHQPIDYSKMKVGTKTLDDAVLRMGDLKDANPQLADKKFVLDAIARKDYKKMREISNFFYRVSGIYARLCRYMAYLYKFDWWITPYIISDNVKSKGNDRVLKSFNDALYYLDNSELKKLFGNISLKVMKNGSFYGYLIYLKDQVIVQELPVAYCRSRYGRSGRAVVELNLKYFDEEFRDTEYRQRVLKLFPKEIQQGYNKYHQNKLRPDYNGDDRGWYMLDPKCAVKFNINDADFPPMISVIPAIIDLDEAQELDRRKMKQQLLKIIIQKMPMDKNGELIFDIDEMQQLHNNAVAMLGKAIGIDVLTTFAEVDVADLADNSTTTTTDELEKVERAIFNEAGVSQLQFNADGNIALQYSIANDEASIYNLVAQYENFINLILNTKFNKNPKKFYFRGQILPTTIYNYKELAKLYKDNVQLGYSKILPQLALGQSQSSIIATAHFENDVLDLASVFVPPMSSNTMSADALNKKEGNTDSKTEKKTAVTDTDKAKGGRPEKDDTEKSTKTLQNKESAS
jgi:hypothetical protein